MPAKKTAAESKKATPAPEPKVEVEVDPGAKKGEAPTPEPEVEVPVRAEDLPFQGVSPDMIRVPARASNMPYLAEGEKLKETPQAVTHGDTKAGPTKAEEKAD